jgi:hypothetical protein
MHNPNLSLTHPGAHRRPYVDLLLSEFEANNRYYRTNTNETNEFSFVSRVTRYDSTEPSRKYRYGIILESPYLMLVRWTDVGQLDAAQL